MSMTPDTRVDLERIWPTFEVSAKIGVGRPGGLSRLTLSDDDRIGYSGVRESKAGEIDAYFKLHNEQGRSWKRKTVKSALSPAVIPCAGWVYRSRARPRIPGRYRRSRL